MMRFHVVAGLLLLTAGAALAQGDAAAGFRGLFIHDQCIGENTEQPDTCLHDRVHQKNFTFGGRSGTIQDVTLRVRGLLEPTRIEGGGVPDPATPWFVIGGESRSPDYSQWQIEVSATESDLYPEQLSPHLPHDLQGGFSGHHSSSGGRLGSSAHHRRQ